MKEFGYFIGTPKTIWAKNDQYMILLEDFSYIDPDEKTWTAKYGTVIDGASIPRIFWTVVGSPYTGKYRTGAIVHDAYCMSRSETWRDTHRMFYNACRSSGTTESFAKLLYWTVYQFGPRWVSGKSIVRTLPEPSIDKLNETERFIEKFNPTLKEIEEIP